MSRWNQLTPITKLLAYAVAAILAFSMAAAFGAVAALVLSGSVNSPAGEKSRSEKSSQPSVHSESAQDKQADAELTQQPSGAKRGQGTPQDKQTAYADEVGEIQANSVEAFLDSHKKLLHYDGLTSGDVEKMQANQAALKAFANQASALRAPQKYKEHKDVFLPAIDDLHHAAQSAYALAADPISASTADFDHYDHLVNEAAASLQRSNEILGKDYKTIEGVQGVSAVQ